MNLKLFICLLGLSSLSYAGQTEQDINHFIQQSRTLTLSSQMAWLNLLHYKKDVFNHVQSQVDDRAFFLSEKGALNPQSELEADIRGFLSVKSEHPSGVHPQCLFPARLHWLKQQLELDDALPDIACPLLDDWQQNMQADQITILFPSMFLQNPASMFGHTFIRLDAKDKSHLLSQTVSYAAATDASEMFLSYAWKGITGGYPGRFFIEPYYETLQEYSDIEQRDIWEYTLNLSAEEVAQLVRHLWEVKGINFDYYFFRENCAYRLLAVLDVARENSDISYDAHLFYTIPVDTVRGIERAGLIQKKTYRPSVHNRILQGMEELNPEAQDTVIRLSENAININVLEKYSQKEQVLILQLAEEILSLKTTGENTQANKKEIDIIQQQQLALLSYRSRIELEYTPEYKAETPESAHESARWQLVLGELEQQTFYELALRPAFHEFLDSQQGFTPGASINVLETRLRYYKDDKTLKLEQLDIFSMQSLVNVQAWSGPQPWAWPLSRKLAFVIEQQNISESKRKSIFKSEFSAGYAKAFGQVQTYAMLKGQLEYATAYQDNHTSLAGIEMGINGFMDIADTTLQIKANYQSLYRLSGQKGDRDVFVLGAQFNPDVNYGLRLEYLKTEFDNFATEQARLGLQIYF